MSIFTIIFDTFAVYVDLGDTFVTHVEKRLINHPAGQRPDRAIAIEFAARFGGDVKEALWL